MNQLNFDQLSTFVFDLDGCVYSGSELNPGAKEFIQDLIGLNKHIFFLSNNSSDSSDTIRKKIGAMGIQEENTAILVATELAGPYLFEKYGKVKALLVGSEDLEKSLNGFGHVTIPVTSRLEEESPLYPESLPDCVVIGLDTSFSYQKLKHCVPALMRGVKLVATNGDLYHPGTNGQRVPETGAILAAIQAVTGIRDIEYVGKPSAFPFEQVMKITRTTPEQCVMIGDNPYTDIFGGQSIGMRTIWISHGVTYPDHLSFIPDWTVQSMQELYEWHKKSLRRSAHE